MIDSIFLFLFTYYIFWYIYNGIKKIMKILQDINEIFYKSTDVEQKAFININKYVLREGTSQVSLINYHDVTK